MESALISSEDKSGDLLAIDEALSRLAERDPRQSQVVELRFFGGRSEEEIDEILGREWCSAIGELLEPGSTPSSSRT